jgi:HicB family
MARKRDDTIKLVLRLPPPLHRRLTRIATRNNQSLNSEMVSGLARWAEEHDPPAQNLRERKKLIEYLQQHGAMSNLWGTPFAEVTEKLDKLIALAERQESEDK